MKIIINADDLGLKKESNLGIERAIKKGFCSQTTLIVNSEHTEEGVNIAFHNHFEENVGLHLNLCEGKPLTKEILKFDKFVTNGNFDYTPLFLQKKSYSKSPIYTYINEINTTIFDELVYALREEIEAQIKQYLSFGFKMKHLDSHRNSIVDLPVWLALKPLLKKYKFKSIRNVFFSFYSMELMNTIYSTWMNSEYNNTKLKKADFVSSIPRFLSTDTHVTNDIKTFEFYIHPILKEKQLIDDFTDNNTVDVHIKELSNIFNTITNLVSYTEI